ncbi:hypothetical protein IJJ08_01925 [bacterium]|nr:hypothetical protein [bacterium]
MRKSNQILSVIMCTVAVVSVCLNIFLMATYNRAFFAQTTLEDTQIAYKLYIVIPNEVTNTDDYIHRLEGILADRVPGFTMYPTRGGSHNDDGSVDYRTTLVCELYGTDKQTVEQISHEAMAAFGLSSVPIASSVSQWQMIR